MKHNSVQVTAFLPGRLRVFDSQGNSTGLSPDGSHEEGIPGSSFDKIEDQQFVTVPDGEIYRVVTEGVGEGDMTLWQTDIDATGLVLRTLEWDQVPMRPGTVNELVTQFDAPNPELAVDLDGDGSPEQTLPLSNLFPGGAGPMLLADLNGDGKVNAADLAIVRASLGTARDTPRYNSIADVNQDGIIDDRDLAWISKALVACRHDAHCR